MSDPKPSIEAVKHSFSDSNIEGIANEHESIRHLDSHSLHWHDLRKIPFLTSLAATVCVIRLCLYPAALAKTRMQVDSSSPQHGVPSLSTATTLPKSNMSTTQPVIKAKPLTSFQTIALQYKKHGLAKGLYRGFPFNCLGIGVDPIFITTLENIKSYLTHLSKDDQYNKYWLYRPFLTDAGISMTCSGVAAAVGQIGLVPCDIVTQKLQLDNNVKTKDVINDIIRREGIRGMYKGYAMTLCAVVPFNALVWTFYWKLQNAAKSYFQKNPLPKNVNPFNSNTEFETSDWRELVCAPVSAAIAATASSLATQPFDVMKVRMQVVDKAQPVRQIFNQLVAEKGLRGIMSGSLPRIGVLMPGTVIMMGAYEAIKRSCVKPLDQIKPKLINKNA